MIPALLAGLLLTWTAPTLSCDGTALNDLNHCTVQTLLRPADPPIIGWTTGTDPDTGLPVAIPVVQAYSPTTAVVPAGTTAYRSDLPPEPAVGWVWIIIVRAVDGAGNVDATDRCTGGLP